MTRKLKVIGLALLAVCSIGAASAGSAQAAAHWTVAGKSFAGTESLIETVKLTSNVKLTVPGLSLTIECTGLKAKGGQIEGGNKGTITSLNFSGCTVSNPAAKCQVRSAGAAVGTINTEALDLEVATVSSTTFIYMVPAGTDITEVVVEKITGAACALTGIYNVHGTISMRVPTGTNTTNLSVESSESLQKLSTAHIFFGAKESYLDMAGSLSLVSDQTWGVGP